jgi:hypothetical protein
LQLIHKSTHHDKRALFSASAQAYPLLLYAFSSAASAAAAAATVSGDSRQVQQETMLSAPVVWVGCVLHATCVLYVLLCSWRRSFTCA